MENQYKKQTLSARIDIFKNSLFAFEMHEAIMNDALLKEVHITANEPNSMDLIEVLLPFENTRILICPNIIDCTYNR